MATFAITVDVSPLATAIELYYTHVLPDGTISSPSQKYTGVGVGGFIVLPATPHPPGYTYTISNIVLNDNTVYNFEVKQFCVDNTIEYSPIDEDHYRVNCIPLSLTVGGYDYQNEVYPIVATWSPAGGSFDPNNYSIQDYTLHVKYTVSGTPVIDPIVVPSVPATVPGTGYVYNITSDDLSNPIAYGESYEVSISFNIVLSDGSTVEVTCPYKSVLIPRLATYRVYAAEYWDVAWQDENGVYQRCANQFTTGATNPSPGVGYGRFFMIYTIVTPRCGYCVGVLPQPPASNYYVAPGEWKVGYITNSTPYDPYWGANFEFVGNGYVTIPGMLPPICQAVVPTVCLTAPNWP